MFQSILCIIALAVCAFHGGHAFVLSPAAGALGGSHLSTVSYSDEGSFVSRLPSAASLTIAHQEAPPQRITRGDLRMAKGRKGKIAKFGIFSPAVFGAKVALGESRLNKLRGKAIALHSQVITEYCKWVGAPGKLRGLLIRKAKKNGDDLGFLW